MSQMLLLQGNPKRRKGKKRRSAAQRRAAANLVAANKARHGKRRSRRRHAVARSGRRVRRSRGFGFKMSTAGIMGMLKPAMIGGAGAVAVDVAMGYASSVLPATFVSRYNADGTMNWIYYLTKGAVAYGLGTVVKSPVAREMAQGSLVVTSYEIIRSLIPAGTVPLGYVNPARIVTRQPGIAGNMGKVLTMQPRGATPLRGLGVRLPVATRSR